MAQTTGTTAPRTDRRLTTRSDGAPSGPLDTPDAGPPATDLWLAFLGGERVWIDGEVPPRLVERFAATLECVVLSSYVVMIWTILPDRLRLAERTWPIWVAVVAGTVAATVLWIRPLTIGIARAVPPVSLVWRATWRAAAFATLAIALVVMTDGWLVFAAWTLGVVAGADAFATTRSLGVPVAPWQWWRRFLLSPMHFGVIGAVVAAIVSDRVDLPSGRILVLYVGIHIAALLAGLTILFLDGLVETQDAERESDRRRVVERERQHRIHWLHDDVLSEIRITAMRVRSDGATPEHAARELDELDHRIRLRQLDEVFLGGPVRLAEILQPHLRRLQSLGVDLVAVPSLDVVGRRVDEVAGRRFGRAVAVLTSNAVNAGARTVAVGVRADHDRVELTVTDDAGGFDLDRAPAGRGLHLLRDDLGHDAVRRVDVPGGSTMVAVVELAPDGPGPPDAAAIGPPTHQSPRSPQQTRTPRWPES